MFTLLGPPPRSLGTAERSKLMTDDATTQIRLLDLDLLDARELQRALPPGSCSLETESVGPTEHGDLGTSAAVLIAVGPPVLLAFAKWIEGKVSRKPSRSMLLTTERVSAKGVTSEKRRLEIREESGESTLADILQHMADAFKIDPE